MILPEIVDCYRSNEEGEDYLDWEDVKVDVVCGVETLTVIWALSFDGGALLLCLLPVVCDKTWLIPRPATEVFTTVVYNKLGIHHLDIF